VHGLPPLGELNNLIDEPRRNLEIIRWSAACTAGWKKSLLVGCLYSRLPGWRTIWVENQPNGGLVR